MERTTFDCFVTGTAGLVAAGTTLYMAPVVTPPAIVAAVFAGVLTGTDSHSILSSDPEIQIQNCDKTPPGPERDKKLREITKYAEKLKTNPITYRSLFVIVRTGFCAVAAVLATCILQVGMNLLLGGSATLFGGLAITAIGGALAYCEYLVGKPLLATGLALTGMVALPMLGYAIPGVTLAAGSSFALSYKASVIGVAVGTVAATALYLVRDLFFAQSSSQPIKVDVQQIQQET